MKRLHDWPRFGLTCFLTSLCLLTSAAWACNVPVFRYALENWRPDAYRLTVFHEVPLTEEELKRLSEHVEPHDSRPLNLSIRTVDTHAFENPADRELFQAIKNSELPSFTVQYPKPLRLETPLQTGSINGPALAQLVDSPVRQELVRRLADGQTAVWLMLDSGLEEQDAAAADLLEKELPALTQKLKLPELTESPEDILRGALPLRLSFSLLRVSRQDEAEQALMAMLLGSEPDLATENAPLVFPVFGRCRALLPLVGAGITPENIRSSAAFLVGACSCQVKELNPGFDLLITADWETLLKLDGISLAATSAVTNGATAEPVMIPIPGGSATVTENPPSPSPSAVSASPRFSGSARTLTAALGVIGVLLLLVIASRR